MSAGGIDMGQEGYHRNARRARALAISMAGLLACGSCSLPGGGTRHAGGGQVALTGTLGFASPECPWIMDDAGGIRWLLLGRGFEYREPPPRVVVAATTATFPAGSRIEVSGLEPDGGSTLCGDGVPFPVDTIKMLDP